MVLSYRITAKPRPMMIMMLRATQFLTVIFCVVKWTLADNPLISGSSGLLLSVPDPHIHIFDDVAYMYTGRDLSPNVTHFVMPDWHVWSSTDLISWRHETTIFPNQTYIGRAEGSRKDPECWAVDVVLKRDGSLYAFFFSNGGKNFGVMTSSSPSLHDAVDALNRPLVSTVAQPSTPPGVHVTNLTTGAYDPSALVDDNDAQTVYISFGLHWKGSSSYLIAKLDESLTQLAETPRKIVFLPNPRDNSTMPNDDKSTLHKYRGVYYLSAGTYYATATNVYGPYTFRGASNEHLAISDDRSFGDTHQAHGRFFQWRGQWFHVWCEFVGLNNTGRVIKGKGYARWRDAWMTYTHYTDSGALVDDWAFLDQHSGTGVGQYDAGWRRVEAEWYMAADGVEKVQLGAGFPGVQTPFGVKFYNGPGAIRFPNVFNLPENAVLTIGVANVTLPKSGVAQKRKLGALRHTPAYIGKIVVMDADGDTIVATCNISAEVESVSCPFSAGKKSKAELLFSSLPEVDMEGSFIIDWWSLSDKRSAEGTVV